MKLKIVFCATSPNGMAYLATDGVKGARCSTPRKIYFRCQCNGLLYRHAA